MKTLGLNGATGELSERNHFTTEPIQFPVRIFVQNDWRVIEDEDALAELVWEVAPDAFTSRTECEGYVRSFICGGSKTSTAQKAERLPCMFDAMGYAV